jgi:hypothetical protein
LEQKANLAATISRSVFVDMSLYCVKSGMKKKDIVELALLEFLEKHDKERSIKRERMD